MRLKILLALIIVSLIIPKNTYAYIDPGSGSYMFQILLAGIFGGVFAIKIYWKKIISLLRNVFSKKKETKA